MIENKENPTALTLDQYTEQEIFDFVAKSLLEQDEQCWDRGCAYRGKVGYKGEILKCAAGFLIPDDIYQKYSEELEGNRWCDVITVKDENDIDIFKSEHWQFIQKLQDVHDGNPSEDWPISLMYFAENHKLNWKVVEPYLSTVNLNM